MSKNLTIVDFKPEYAQDFHTITKEWVESMFGLEEIDASTLSTHKKILSIKAGIFSLSNMRVS